MPMFTRPSVKHCKTIRHAKKVIQHAVKQQNQNVHIVRTNGSKCEPKLVQIISQYNKKQKTEKVVHTTFGWKLESEKTGSKQKLR